MPDNFAIGVFGAKGFVGSAVVNSLNGDEFGVEELPRVALPEGIKPHSMAADLERGTKEIVGLNEALLERLSDVKRLVNAAGLAAPTEPDYKAQWRTNTLLPAVVDLLANEAGIERIVHVSSAAVQADVSVLDESSNRSAITAYARSKADAESYLERDARVPTIIYRATSVIGPGRAVVNSLKTFYRGKLAPVFGDGSAPLPLSALPNTAAAISHLVRSESAPGVALQPWEGVSQRSLAEALRGPNTRLLRIPVPTGSRMVRSHADRLPGPVLAQVRRLDLLVFGQGQDASYLPSDGFVPPVDTVQYLADLD